MLPYALRAFQSCGAFCGTRATPFVKPCLQSRPTHFADVTQLVFAAIALRVEDDEKLTRAYEFIAEHTQTPTADLLRSCELPFVVEILKSVAEAACTEEDGRSVLEQAIRIMQQDVTLAAYLSMHFLALMDSMARALVNIASADSCVF